MIKALLFDYDGVITKGVDVALPAERLASNINIPVDQATELIMQIWSEYSTGKLTTDDVWLTFEKQLGHSILLEQRNIWHTWDELTPLSFMIDFVNELRASEYKVGLLSNVFQDTAELIRQNGGYDAFDFLLLSCEVGARKPDPLIYRTAMTHLPDIEPAEVIYLDDREHLVEAGNEFGLRSVHVTDHRAAIDRVRAMLAQ